MEPLILTDRRDAPGWVSGWGTAYALVVTSQGVCSTHDREKQWSIVQRIGQKKGGEVKVRATVEHWAPGAEEPRSQELETIVAPVIFQESNLTPFRRSFKEMIRFSAAADTAIKKQESGAEPAAEPAADRWPCPRGSACR